ncbi:hypothetical protein CEUSTIGMA_g8835.t1 [Chlamydomonas eustigma]|uniref:Reverse transcriptase/retrotransposon-derived protein RNase H-like domain-containing protein n=1 Tax=Chlamydomonas eustigma TaxID=1157962 RepID=A0A250XE94_9CHLO|nr:hypothetical protein CEUSTIGMA_g8835.t1 [Chlamydomonas eustigma]|eukprot:GAX81404.1 hypothetical protein CEUSTIGMA_g8835.t1 [Chlamydomonas eustigma]
MILAAEGDGLALGTLGRTSDRPVDMISTAGREGSAPAEFVCTSPARTITAEEEDSALGTCHGPVAMMSATEGEGSAPAVCFFPSPAASSERLHVKHRHRVIMCSRRNGEINRNHLEDVMILSKNPDEHLVHLTQVFEKIRSNGMQLRLSKCKFLQSQVKYLGHLLSADDVQADPDKINTLVDWEFPSTATCIQQFLGLANYFRKFSPNLSRLAAPLYRMTKKGGLFEKGEEAPLSFKAIKEALASPPVLAYPHPELPYELISDASITGCVGVLTWNEGNEGNEG